MSRNYRKEYDNYQGSAKQKKERALRNKVRRKLMREGVVKKGDNKDVAHKDNNVRNQKRSNLRVQDRSINRSFSRTKKAKRK